MTTRNSANQQLLFLLLIFYLYQFSINTLNACSCGNSIHNQLTEEYLNTDSHHIFSGEVLSINYFSWIPEDESDPVKLERSTISGRIVQLKVFHSYSPLIRTDTIEIITGNDPFLDCGFPFEIQKEYLVITGPKPNKTGHYSTSICVPTKLLSLAENDILLISNHQQQEDSLLNDPILEKIELGHPSISLNHFGNPCELDSINLFNKDEEHYTLLKKEETLSKSKRGKTQWMISLKDHDLQSSNCVTLIRRPPMYIVVLIETTDHAIALFINEKTGSIEKIVDQ